MYACSAAMALTLLVVSADRTDAGNHRDSRDAGRPPLVRFVGAEESGSTAQASSPTPARYSRASYSSVLGESASYAEPQVPPSALRVDEPLQQFTPASHSTVTSHVNDMPHAVCDNCGPCGRFGRCWGIGGKLPAWRAKHDFTPHIPYRALPADYYYFRPYNYTDIPEDQAEVAVYGQDPRMPYDNRVFEGIYEGLDEETIPPVDGMPMDEEPMDEDSTTDGESPFVPVPPPDTPDASPAPQPSSDSDPQSSLQPRRLNPQDRQRSVIFSAPPIPGGERLSPSADTSNTEAAAERLNALPLSPAMPRERVIRQTSGARVHLSDQGASSLPRNSLR